MLMKCIYIFLVSSILSLHAGNNCKGIDGEHKKTTNFFEKAQNHCVKGEWEKAHQEFLQRFTDQAITNCTVAEKKEACRNWSVCKKQLDLIIKKNKAQADEENRDWSGWPDSN